MNAIEFYESYLGLNGHLAGSGWYRACCPIHGERRPSFAVNTEYPYNFNCLACGQRGQLPYLVSKVKGIPLKVAVEVVREKLDLQIDLDALIAKRHKHVVEPVPDAIVDAYKDALRGSVGSEYLRYRGIPKFVAESFDVGYDQLDARLMVPVRSVTDSGVVGFDTRGFVDSLDRVEKKIIIPDAIKGKIVIAGTGYRKKVGVIVCEGFMDVAKVTLWLMRTGNTRYTAIALCGTQASEDHLRLLHSFDYVTLGFDNDAAGDRAKQFVARRLGGYAPIQVNL